MHTEKVPAGSRCVTSSLIFMFCLVHGRGGGEGSKQCPQLGRLRAFIFSFSFGLIYGGLSWRFVANCGELLTLLCVLIHAFLAFLSWC